MILSGLKSGEGREVYFICIGMTSDIVDSVKLPLKMWRLWLLERYKIHLDRSSNVEQLIDNDPSMSGTFREHCETVFEKRSMVCLTDFYWKSQTCGFFSDEKNVCLDQAHNRWNNRWLAVNPKDVPRVMKIKFPVHMMVFVEQQILKMWSESNMFWIISDEKNVYLDQAYNRWNSKWLAVSPKDMSRVMKIKFIWWFSVSLAVKGMLCPHTSLKKMNQNVYQNWTVLATVIKPWIERIAAGRPYVFEPSCWNH